MNIRVPEQIIEERPVVPSLRHAYPRDPRWRRSGAAIPQVGDIALCGWVKRTPPHGGPSRPVTCVVCAALSEAAR